MKKFIAILLVVLVAGVMFGADDPADATLTLNASMGNRTNHGFVGSLTGLGSFGAIYNSTGIGDNEIDELDLESDDPQEAGYYVFASNSKTKLIVSFTANPLKSENLETQVPYILTATYVGGNNVGGAPTTAPSWDLTDGGNKVAGDTIAPVESDLISLTTSMANGAKWATYSLAVEFDATGNIAYGLEEGAYTGTVVANIVTQ